MPNETKQKSIGKIIVKLFVALVLIAFFTTPFVIKDIERRSNPNSDASSAQSNSARRSCRQREQQEVIFTQNRLGGATGKDSAPSGRGRQR